MTLLRITWKKSYIGRSERQRRVIHALGLSRLHQTVVHGDSPTIRGMVNKVSYMLDVEQFEEPSQTPQPEKRHRSRSTSGQGEKPAEVSNNDGA